MSFIRGWCEKVRRESCAGGRNRRACRYRPRHRETARRSPDRDESDDLPRAFRLHQGRAIREKSAREERGHAEGAVVFRGHDRAAGALVRGDERFQRGGGKKRLIAEQENGGGARDAAEQRAQAGAQRAAHAVAPVGIFRDEHAGLVELRADLRGVRAEHDDDRRIGKRERRVDGVVQQRGPAIREQLLRLAHAGRFACGEDDDAGAHAVVKG